MEAQINVGKVITADRFVDSLRRANLQLERLFRWYAGVLPRPFHQELRILIGVVHALREIDTGLELEVWGRQRQDLHDELIVYRANLLRLHRELSFRERLAMMERRGKRLTTGRPSRAGSNLIPGSNLIQ